jgi:phosphoribosylformylglycinamidine synthase
MGQFVGCLKGIGEACRALDFPVVSGNVSLYNETEGRGILPTPSIGGVGLVKDVARTATLAFRASGEVILLVGATTGWLGQSLWLRDVCGREEGAPPPVDLAVERRNGEAVRGLIAAGRVSAVHDLSDGGLAAALAESCMARGVGATIEALPEGPAHAVLFGEDQGRYLVACAADEAAAILRDLSAAGVPAQRIGTTGGAALTLPGEKPVEIAALRNAHETWLPDYMGGEIINS